MNTIQWLHNFSHQTFSSLKVRNYRLYFIGQSISLSGTWMQTIGQSWLVLKLTGSGTALGVLLALQFLPSLIIGSFIGVVIDRFSKRKLIFLTQSILAILALILGIIVITGIAKIWMIYTLATFFGIATAIDNPTRHSFIVEMVGPEKLKNAITLNSTLFNLGRAVGPAIAGIVIAALGIAPCFFINALSFIAVLVCLWMMHPHELIVAESITEMKGQFKKGIEYIISMPVILDVLIMMAIVGMLTYEFQVSLALLASNTFHGDARTYALLTTAFGLGSVIGGIATANRNRTSLVHVIWLSLAFGVTVLLTAFATSPEMAALSLVLVGVVSIIFTSTGNTLVQLTSDPKMRGRVMAFWSVAIIGTTPIGGPIIGWIGQHIDPRASLIVGGVAAIFAGTYGYFRIKSRS